jgi:membrane-bound ClpP family serine protease
MKEDKKTLMWIGVAIIILPFLGVPVLWKSIILFLAGIYLISQSVFTNDKQQE